MRSNLSGRLAGLFDCAFQLNLKWEYIWLLSDWQLRINWTVGHVWFLYRGLRMQCKYIWIFKSILACFSTGRLSHGDWCHSWPRGWQHTHGDGRGEDKAERNHVLHWYQSAEGSPGEHGGYVSTQKRHEWVSVCIRFFFLCFCFFIVYCVRCRHPNPLWS